MRQKNFYNSVVFCLLSFFISGCGASFHFNSPGLTGKTMKRPSISLAADHNLRIGEKLTYEIRWMGIPVGLACFNVKEIVQINSRDCYHICVSVRSNAFLSKIYKVDDEFQTYIDKENLYSLRFIKRQAEGRYRSHEVVDYDQQAHKALYKSLLNDSTKEFNIEENSQDDLSSIYYFRMKDIEADKPVFINVNADEKNWILQIDFLEQGIMNLSRIGDLDAIAVEPVAKTTDGKPLEKGRVWLWFSADENRIPLAAKAKASIVGTVSAVLTDVQ